MGFIENNLTRNETVIEKAKFSWVALLPWIVCLVAVLGVTVFILKNTETNGVSVIESDGVIAFMFKNPVTLILPGLALLALIVRILTLANAKLVVTNKRVMGKVGVISRKTVDMHLTKVDNISIKQDFWGRILGYSIIEVQSVNSSTQFPFIRNAYNFKNIVMQAIDTQREKDRVEQANLMAQAMAKNNIK